MPNAAPPPSGFCLTASAPPHGITRPVANVGITTQPQLSKKVQEEAKQILNCSGFGLFKNYADKAVRDKSTPFQTLPTSKQIRQRYLLHRMADADPGTRHCYALYDLMRQNRMHQCHIDQSIPVRHILQTGAAEQQTIVAKTLCGDNATKDKTTVYCTDHAQIRDLLDITDDQIAQRGVRDFIPNEHALPTKPTAAQLVQILILLSKSNRTATVRSNMLNNSSTTIEQTLTENRATGTDFDIISAPPGTGKTGVTLEAALALMRGNRLPEIMRTSPEWWRNVRSISQLGVHYITSDLADPKPCNLIILVTPNNVAGYWLRTLQHAVSQEPQNYTIYPKESGAIRNIVWPLTIFDEFTAHCGNMGIEAKAPACKLFWAISATPNTITEVFNGKSSHNPFKKMLSDRFTHAETELSSDRIPKHFERSLEQRRRIIESNLMVSLITAFPPALIRRTIDNVLHLMPPTVRYVASDAAARTAEVALGRYRPSPTVTARGDPPKLPKFTVADFTVDPPILSHTFDCHDKDYAPTHLGDFRLPSKNPPIRWRQPETDHKLVSTQTLLQDLQKAYTTFQTHQASFDMQDLAVAQNWFKNTEATLKTPTFPPYSSPRMFGVDQQQNHFGVDQQQNSPATTKTTAACTRCCCVIDLHGLQSHFWLSHHYDPTTQRIRCPGCFHSLSTSSMPLLNSAEVASTESPTSEILQNLRDGTSYAAALYATFFDAITQHDARSIVIFADAALASSLIKHICDTINPHANVACHRLTDRIPATNIKQSTTAGKKDAVVRWYQEPYQFRRPLECRVLILDATASQKSEEVCGLNFQDTDRMIICNAHVSDAQQALARALRAKQTDHARPPLTLNIFCDQSQFVPAYIHREFEDGPRTVDSKMVHSSDAIQDGEDIGEDHPFDATLECIWGTEITKEDAMKNMFDD
ncbi:hypothetical protein CYMTET_8756 [Cymbomonas tetramitiformis]|uniref:Uncharacterized protein n=1 Tax=Cymbomonas tetramitiformis TaxID=36881 RepID=A0AAE0GU96_9CHLO|nr:hypothetical protein CYMTET_8756 [Cymbomonas tetramitiformis]